jgi:hypothetical protein
MNEALEYIKSKHNGEIPYKYGSNECAKLMTDFAEAYHQNLVKESNVRRSLPMFHIGKHYNNMNRRERREYKRWLDKHNMWDGAIISENLER